VSNGYIKLHRELLDSKLWSCSDATLRVALYLLLSANHGTAWHRRIEIGRGQCVRSLTQISEACNLSRKAVRYALAVLSKDEFIRTDEPFGAQQGHRVTICKYDTYQGHKCDKGTAGAQEGNHEGNHQGNTNKKNKNEKEEEEEEQAVAGAPAPVAVEEPPEPDKPAKTAPKRFVPPTIEELAEYCQEKGFTFDPEAMLDHYEANGWMRGKTKVKDWKATARTWARNDKEFHKPRQPDLGSSLLPHDRVPTSHDQATRNEEIQF